MLLLAFAALWAVSDDWPQLLSPHRNGVYTGETVGWPSQFAWQKEVQGDRRHGPLVSGSGQRIDLHAEHQGIGVPDDNEVSSSPAVRACGWIKR
jgi:hypothetical protein